MAEMIPARAIIVDPRSLFCEVISVCLTSHGHVVLGHAKSFDDAKLLMDSMDPNVAIVGPHFMEQSLRVCQEIVAYRPMIKVAVFSANASSPTFQADAVRVHASACLEADSANEEWLAVMAKIMAGQRFFSDEILSLAYMPLQLTSRELQVLGLMVAGRSDREIAKTLRIKFCTARNHSQHILDKFYASSRQEVIWRARYRSMV